MRLHYRGRGRAALLGLAAGFAALSLLTAPVAAAPSVVASILPLHSLTAALMAGVGEPRLLVEGAASPHSFSLKPSDARALDEAELVIWIGEGLESFLQRPLETLGEKEKVVTLSEAEGMRLLRQRAPGLKDRGATVPDRAQDRGSDDLHLWLDPANAIVAAETIAEALARRDPEHAQGYQKNLRQLKETLLRLEQRAAEALAPHQAQRFLVFHDAYQYFEQAFGLQSAGSLMLDPERQPGARRLRAMRNWVGDAGELCVFTEPQFEPRLARVLTEDTKAHLAVLDPLGADLEPGPEAYVDLMEGLVRSFIACFEALDG